MNKNKYSQMIRGICILAVVMIHCPKGTSGIDQTIWLAIRQVINFPVALFIFLAGYFVNPSKVNIKWLEIRGGGRLLIPYLVWSTIYTVKNAIFSDASFKSLVFSFITGNSAAPLYYILVLLQLSVLTLFLVKRRPKWLYLITPVYLIFIYTYNITTGNTPMYYQTLFPAWFIFYLLGMDVRDGKFNGIKIRIWMIILALAASFGEAYLLIKLGCSVGFACSQIKISSFLYSALIALWLSQNSKEIKDHFLSIVGDCSYGIYFSHMLVMWVVSKVISMVGIEIWSVKLILTFVLTAGISFMFVWIVRRVFKGKRILRYIGFD